MVQDRHSHTELPDLITDPDELDRQEVENGLRQFDRAMDYVRLHVQDAERPFRLNHGLILELHQLCLDRISMLAGTYRNVPAGITPFYASPGF